MARYFTAFAIPHVATTHRLFEQLLLELDRQARARPRIPGAHKRFNDALVIYRRFNQDLATAAKLGARRADLAIEGKIASTQKRPDTGLSPHLRDLIKSRPAPSLGSIETGAVLVASIEELDKTVNPNTPSFGPYWRAQEFGTGTPEVPSQVGRVLLGAFQDGGGLYKPDPAYAGGNGPHPVFLTRRILGSGSLSGLGTIGVEIQGRHFLRDGSHDAKLLWSADIRRTQADAIVRLRSLTRP